MCVFVFLTPSDTFVRMLPSYLIGRYFSCELSHNKIWHLVNMILKWICQRFGHQHKTQKEI